MGLRSQGPLNQRWKMRARLARPLRAAIKNLALPAPVPPMHLWFHTTSRWANSSRSDAHAKILSPAQGTSAAPGTKGPRVGLSPKVLELNKRMHAAKELKGSRLAQQEVTAVRAEFDDFWASLPETASYVEAYQDWRETRASEPERMCAFQPSWGGGSYFSPISSEEFFHYHARHGWPTDREVFDKDGADSAIEPDDPYKFLDSVSTRLWSLGASARNVSRRSVPSEQQFTIVERGLANAIEGAGREAAEAGC